MMPGLHGVMILSISAHIYHLQLFVKSADEGSLDQYQKVRLQKQKVAYAFLCFIQQCTPLSRCLILTSHHHTDMSIQIYIGPIYGVPT